MGLKISCENKKKYLEISILDDIINWVYLARKVFIPNTIVSNIPVFHGKSIIKRKNLA